jgi:hypothetical protein
VNIVPKDSAPATDGRSLNESEKAMPAKKKRAAPADIDIDLRRSGRPQPMRKFAILLSAALLVGTILLVLRGELNARGPQTECGFWGDMEAGMSCR